MNKESKGSITEQAEDIVYEYADKQTKAAFELAMQLFYNEIRANKNEKRLAVNDINDWIRYHRVDEEDWQPEFFLGADGNVHLWGDDYSASHPEEKKTDE